MAGTEESSVHDIVVLGGGPGGYAVAFRAAARGLDVALVEEAQLGGTCLHRGCIPSKSILHVAEVLGEVHRAETLGLKLTFDGLNGDALSAFRTGVIDQLHKGLEFLAKQRTTLHHGRGRIVRDDGGRLAVDVAAADGSGEVTRVHARHVVLATGSVPRGLPGIEVDGDVVQTSDEALWFTEAPEHAVIIGAGAIGMEFASMWRPMGSRVTVVEALDRVLPLEDLDSSKAVTKAYRRRGIDVMTSTRLRSIDVLDGRATIEVEVTGAVGGKTGAAGGKTGAVGGKTGAAGGQAWSATERLEADRVLIAIGRGPNTADTGAQELGVLDDRGFAVTDAYGATEVDRLWAVGDVRPTLALAHAAFAEGFVLADRIAGVDDVQPVDHAHTPRVTYCHPEVASVGLTEAEARQQLGDDGVSVTTYSMKANAKGIIAGSDGHVKVVHATGGSPVGAPGDGGAVLGVHLVGPHATDLIGEATLATSWGAVPAELAAITHAHPSLYEAMGEAFQAAAGLPFHGH
jgi:dihydrolipoamide dehydrogenase